MKIWCLLVKGELPGKPQVNFQGHLCSLNSVYAPTAEQAAEALQKVHPLLNFTVIAAIEGPNLPFSPKKIGVVGEKQMLYPA